MAKCVRPGELADVKSGTGKERSMVLVWTISNSSPPSWCKEADDRGMISCSIRGSLWLFRRIVCEFYVLRFIPCL